MKFIAKTDSNPRIKEIEDEMKNIWEDYNKRREWILKQATTLDKDRTERLVEAAKKLEDRLVELGHLPSKLNTNQALHVDNQNQIFVHDISKCVCGQCSPRNDNGPAS